MTYYLSFQNLFVFLRMKFLRVKGGASEARPVSEAMTMLLQNIGEVLVESFIYFMENTIWVWRLLSKAFSANMD